MEITKIFRLFGKNNLKRMTVQYYVILISKSLNNIVHLYYNIMFPRQLL
jgi:hypothetical protein